MAVVPGSWCTPLRHFYLPLLLPAARYCFAARYDVGLCVCPSHKVARFTSRKDHSVPIPGRVCLLCLALQIFLFNFFQKRNGVLLHFVVLFLADSYYVMFDLLHEPSVCRLSLTLLHPRYTVQLIGNIFPPPIAQELGQFVLKFWTKIRRGSKTSCKLNTKGMKN